MKMNTEKRNTRLYSIWRNMKTRCYNKKAPKYKTYGEKGVRICKEWKDSFDTFYNWSISHGYQDSLSLDRINPKGNYEPSNCRWADATEQACNKTNSRKITYKGKEMNISELSKKTGIARSTLYKKSNEKIKQMVKKTDSYEKIELKFDKKFNKKEISNILYSSKEIEEKKRKEIIHQVKHTYRIDSIPAGSTYFNEQGFLHDNPIVTSTGIFEYALPDGGIRRELRLPEYVFEKESLASYIGKPVIITHEAGSIDKNNVMNEIVGTILSEGYRDKEDVRCKIVIHDIDKVKKTPYRELSLGYSLDLLEEPGIWEGEPYDAIQTNIRINHLAIVPSARAGEQAHLNLDSKKATRIEDRKNIKGGKKVMKKLKVHNDSIDMTPEELMEAIQNYKATHSNSTEQTTSVADEEEEDEIEEETLSKIPAAKISTEQKNIKEKKNEDISSLIETMEKLLATLKENTTSKAESETTTDEASTETENTLYEEQTEKKKDSSKDTSQSINADSADDIFCQRLHICRIGDKIHMDGLENKSILEGKKAIIAKVLPTIHLDGKSKAYIDAAYDLAVSEINQRKDVTYQKNQMIAVNRVDSNNHQSMASSARQRMLDREGGKA